MGVGSIFRVAAGALNLRGGPGKGFAVVKVLPRGTLVASLTDEATPDGWLRVTANAAVGFVSLGLLEPVSAGAPPGTVTTPTPAAASVDVNRRNVDPAFLHPRFRDAAAQVLDRLARDGIPFRMFEGYRGPERQNHLFRQGRDAAGRKIGPVVTNARAWSSFHQYGLAADFVLFVDGKWSWDDSGPRAAWWDRLQAIGRDVGLKALSFERPHLELASASMQDLRAGLLPDGGDESWRDNLEASARRWRGDPQAPGFVTERPPLPESASAPAQ